MKIIINGNSPSTINKIIHKFCLKNDLLKKNKYYYKFTNFNVYKNENYKKITVYFSYNSIDFITINLNKK